MISHRKTKHHMSDHKLKWSIQIVLSKLHLFSTLYLKTSAVLQLIAITLKGQHLSLVYHPTGCSTLTQILSHYTGDFNTIIKCFSDVCPHALLRNLSSFTDTMHVSYQNSLYPDRADTW